MEVSTVGICRAFISLKLGGGVDEPGGAGSSTPGGPSLAGTDKLGRAETVGIGTLLEIINNTNKLRANNYSTETKSIIIKKLKITFY